MGICKVGVSFEEVIHFIENEKVTSVIPHPNQKKYAGQNIFVISIRYYVFLVPFIRDGNKIFLKTIIPNRKATRDYIGENNET